MKRRVLHYGRLDIFWFDVLGKKAKDYDGEALNVMIRKLQPQILINNRDGLAEDFDTPEQVIGKFQYNRPWESCITICNQWAWKPDDTMKSLAQCLETLIRCAGGDGNLLFNVGPMPDGRVEPRQVQRLQEMGDWLRSYGETIYGTRGGPWKPTKTLASTRTGDIIYLHVLDWNGETVSLPNIPRKILRSAALTGGTARVDQTVDKISIRIDPAVMRPPDHGAEWLRPQVSSRARQPQIDIIVKLKLDGSAMDLEPR